MEYIKRPKYLTKIRPFIDKPLVKVLVGMRRVGKSTILEMIKNEELYKVPNKNKLHINFESFKFRNIRNAEDLTAYVMDYANKNEGKLYLLFDEVQLIDGWEKSINSFRVDLECDIYITGSNSNLLSGELATLLAGRYVEFKIQPLSFSEFIRLFSAKKMQMDEYFQKYIQLGGMPDLKYFDLDEFASYKYLSDVYNTVLVKDVISYYRLRDVDMFNRILSYITENVGKTFSANSIKNYIKSESRKVTVDTVINYLEYCQNAFIIDKVSRYDYHGKKMLKIEEKYYLSDHGFRAASGYSNTDNIELVLENIVYNELTSRGYEVKIGKINNKEVDFIAKKDDNIAYYQICYLLESETTRNRELGVYKDIKDNYPKYVISMDKNDFSRGGIIHKNIIDFLLNFKED